jgi:hypothetical protein
MNTTDAVVARAMTVRVHLSRHCERKRSNPLAATGKQDWIASSQAAPRNDDAWSDIIERHTSTFSPRDSARGLPDVKRI